MQKPWRVVQKRSFLKIRKTKSWNASGTRFEVVLGAQKWHQSVKKWIPKFECGRGAIRLPIFIDFVYLQAWQARKFGGLWRPAAADWDALRNLSSDHRMLGCWDHRMVRSSDVRSQVIVCWGLLARAGWMMKDEGLREWRIERMIGMKSRTLELRELGGLTFIIFQLLSLFLIMFINWAFHSRGGDTSQGPMVPWSQGPMVPRSQLCKKTQNFMIVSIFTEFTPHFMK